MENSDDYLNALEVMGYTDIRYRTLNGTYSVMAIRPKGRGTTCVRGAGDSRVEALRLAYDKALKGRTERVNNRHMEPKRRGADVFWAWVAEA